MSGLLRLGVVAGLIDGTVFTFTALALYTLLKDVCKRGARAMLVRVCLDQTATFLHTRHHPPDLQ